MRAILQRAADARVTIGGEVVGSFDGPGIVLLIGVTHGDGDAAAGLDQVSGMADIADGGLRVIPREYMGRCGDMGW